MRTYLPAIAIASFATLLYGCGKMEQTPTVERMLGNPLFAERYAEEMVDALTELQIINDPVLDDEGKKNQVIKIKNEWLATAREARADQRKGLLGNLISIGAFVQGEVLILGNSLYFGPTFEAAPGPTLHVYVSTTIDPRDVEFPDDSAIDLGILPIPYGASELPLPDDIGDLVRFRTVVLWDTTLNRLYGFAQIGPS